MMKKKFNPKILKEEQKKFRLLSEYTFYTEKESIPEFKDLILGDKELYEADEVPSDLKPEDDIEASADKISSDLGLEKGTEGGETAETPSADSVGDASDSMNNDVDFTEPKPEEPASSTASDTSGDVEVDVTSLVKGSEEAKDAADSANKNSEMLLQKLSDLENKLTNMTSISDKIETLEKEIIKRNPTPVEKLEMRSLSSFPFNQKLTDYWADKEGAYDVMGKDKENKEYVLTKNDVDSDYSDASIKKSFSSEDNPYDVETIDDYEEEEY
jgi:hypothetical protein